MRVTPILGNFLNSKLNNTPRLFTYLTYREPKLGKFALVRSESEDVVKYTEIAGPDDISIKTNDNFGDHQFWETIEFYEP